MGTIAFYYNYFNHNLTEIFKSQNSKFLSTLSPHKICKGNRMWLVVVTNKI